MKKYKKLVLSFLVLFMVLAAFSGMNENNAAYANSAPPISSEDSSGIIFEKNQLVKIDSEVLDIKLGTAYAEITASYQMTNLTEESQVIKTLFISPFLYEEDKNYVIMQDGIELSYQIEYFTTSIKNKKEDIIKNWEAVLANEQNAPTPFGTGSGYKLYKNVSSNVIISSFNPTSYFITEETISYNILENNIILIPDTWIITKETLDFVLWPDMQVTESDVQITEIENIYEYLYDSGLEIFRNNYEEARGIGEIGYSEAYYQNLFYDYLQKIQDQEDINISIQKFEIDSGYNNICVGTIAYELNFEPNQTITVTVSYEARLGGTTGVYNVLYYYLTPAGYWADFQDITINVITDKSLPILESNLEFVKIGDYNYQYKSSTLPNVELKLKATPNWFGNIKNFFKNPYKIILIILPVSFLLGIVILIIIVVMTVRKCRGRIR